MVPRFLTTLAFLLLPYTFLTLYRNLSISDTLFLSGLIAALLIWLPFRIEKIDQFFRENPFFLPLLILCSGVLIALGGAFHPGESLTALLQILFIFLAIHPLLGMIEIDETFVVRVTKLFIFSTGTIAAALMLFTIYGIDVSFGLFLLQEGWRGRFSFGGYEPNIPARIVLQMAPLCAAFFLRSRSAPAKMLNGTLIVVAVFVVVSTASRSALLALVVGTLLFPIALKRTNPRTSGKSILAGLTLIVAAGIFTTLSFGRQSLLSKASQRYQTILSARTSSSSLDRLSLMDQAIDQIVRDPIVGVGLDNFRLHTRQAINVHNPILAMGAENGILGMIGLSLIYFVFGIYCVNAWRMRFFGNYLLMGMTIMVVLMIVGDMFMANSYKRVLWVPALLFVHYYDILARKPTTT